MKDSLIKLGILLKAYFNNFVGKSNDKKFIIFAQGRTGSSLLVDLLDYHESIECRGELLNIKNVFRRKKLWSPKAYIMGYSAFHPNKYFGFKAKVYHLFKDQGIDAEDFLKSLHDNGFKVIYLKRENVFRQAISHFVAEKKKMFHLTKEKKLDDSKIHIDLNNIKELMEECIDFQEREKKCLANVDFLKITYEKDLLNSQVQQKTAERIFEYLGLKPAVVETRLKKINTKELSDIISNYDEVVEFLKKNDFIHYLDN